METPVLNKVVVIPHDTSTEPYEVEICMETKIIDICEALDCDMLVELSDDNTPFEIYANMRLNEIPEDDATRSAPINKRATAYLNTFTTDKTDVRGNALLTRLDYDNNTPDDFTLSDMSNVPCRPDFLEQTTLLLKGCPGIYGLDWPKEVSTPKALLNMWCQKTKAKCSFVIDPSTASKPPSFRYTCTIKSGKGSILVSQKPEPTYSTKKMAQHNAALAVLRVIFHLDEQPQGLDDSPRVEEIKNVPLLPEQQIKEFLTDISNALTQRQTGNIKAALKMLNIVESKVYTLRKHLKSDKQNINIELLSRVEKIMNEMWVEKADIFFEKEDDTKAKQYCQKALDKLEKGDNEYLRATLIMAQCHLRFGSTEKASKFLAVAKNLDRKNKQVKDLEEKIRARIHKDKKHVSLPGLRGIFS
mmetsp:Transcript_19609/g.21812  ORF Transcript_19609/g.21812 Transcript_19609/m.21812 type:complete len:416 (+) Transcript_19609:747-1994(+)|eukprot:CAMPEP_0168528628 /NCGR_PEP_ID=MMETSP0405-20121227/13370_1 /TAXON_ID=498012 /ORGANISM="Trichosphaerium sp, Strain Am-I-7 wt" /LENGTH=415 /DNA_ID=CAMNT_0008552085 /DNA_START=727 /DNA_END=1974 /DNA_ORIENTATION=-